MPQKPGTHNPLQLADGMKPHRSPDITDQRRGSACSRGYGHKWRRLRRLVLARDPLCISCRSAGRIVPATEADHIKPRREGGPDSLDNLQGLCKSCHTKKTRAGQ